MAASQSAVKITQIAARAAADKLATEMVALDLSDQMVLSEIFLIVTGANVRQVDSIADEIEEKLRLVGEKSARREGSEEWVLLDYSDLVVHIQSSELRKYYMLDRLWNDCPKIELDIVKEMVADGRSSNTFVAPRTDRLERCQSLSGSLRYSIK